METADKKINWLNKKKRCSVSYLYFVILWKFSRKKKVILSVDISTK